MKQLVERLGGPKRAGWILGLGGTAVLLAVIAIIGAIVSGGDDGTKDDELSTGGGRQVGDVAGPGETTVTVPGDEPGETSEDPAQRDGSPGQPSDEATGGPGGAPGGDGGVPTDGAAVAGGNRTGVSDTSIRWGFHAPETFDGTPLNLAEDPLHGVDIYLNVVNQEKVNGRTIEKVFADDRYTVDGGKQAADKLINDEKTFFVEGTLGIDQVAQVAAEAKKRGVPYLAGGGSENTLKDFGMYQILATYDDALIALAQYLDKETEREGSPYFGLTKVGVSQLDSPHIDGSVESFDKALAERGMELVAVVKIQKPTEQTTYAEEILELKGKGAEIVVPAQDPITTSRMVAECQAQRCEFKWTSSNFAHESDVALTLMQGSWTGYRALGGGCYYLVPDAQAGDVSKCGMLKTAREQWIQAEGERSYNKDGQGGIAGYQFVHAWLKALKEAGPDPTRENFRAALEAYEGYNDLITSPISFKGKSNYSIEGYRFQVILEATDQAGPEGSDQRFTWKQISPGFVDFDRY